MNKDAILRQFREQKELMEDRIYHGIESHRKGYFKINLTDEKGAPVKGAQVSIRQKTHDFKFGCNIFKLKCFPSQEENLLYEERFKKLFNLATAPFYWDAFEPEQGRMRFEKNSSFIDRRIPPELVLEFCRENQIEVKGHPVFWQVMLPDWLPNDYEELKPCLIDRIRAIAQRYDGVIKTFDCVNEVTSVPMLDYEPRLQDTHYRNFKPLSGEYVDWIWRETEHCFRKSRLVLNETTAPWGAGFKKEVSHFYLLAENLIRKGRKVDIIGLQYHNFNKPEEMAALAEHEYNPKHLYKVMDCYAKLGRPLSVSEITVPGYDDGVQAEALRNLYRIWFSHPGMESIVYWNLGDNCAIAGGGGWAEDQYRSGLIRSDFSAKPSFQALDELINKEWRTNLDLSTEEDHLYFKAFFGHYEIRVLRNGQEVVRDLHLSKSGFDEFSFVL
ncbi:endo-1,4-beta-xylanase [Paenibacillus sp. YN15]|uniref:endo-1,4-beta-xylanase n=1 Tax=Paenibacillus sp. YN15 TaxID=1742774 RepID=UPI000DCC7058|nr:endo-1,4-beta-xylanase [Paenibacillus sp. YN15]RAU92722.1 glycoside hydrolase family 10 [Paenibacillus sp. YN15]